MSTFLNGGPVFGPVRSRRLGLSLGVNLMPATGKICSFDCLYCENGFNADRRTADGYVALDAVADALEQKLRAMASEGAAPDVITFAGNGEPTGSPIFPAAIDAALELRDRWAPSSKVAVLSNGTFAARPAVRAALEKVDDNILKLDAHDEGLARLIDRPGVPYSVAQQVETYRGFNGHVIVQSIFLEGTWQGQDVSNDRPDQVDGWLEDVRAIAPGSVEIYTVARETPAPDLHKTPPAVMDEIAAKVRAAGFSCTVAY